MTQDLETPNTLAPALRGLWSAWNKDAEARRERLAEGVQEPPPYRLSQDGRWPSAA